MRSYAVMERGPQDMKITFCGAADGVTGSCHLIETDRYKFLLDCGMFQGGRKLEERNRLPFPFNPEEIDFVILSHAHVDHCGRLPLLVKRGFASQIYCTDATADLTDIMLRDSAYINQRETEYRNKKNTRLGRRLEEPVYTINDAIEAIKYLTPVYYDVKKKIRDGITLRFRDAGHMLGSSSIELWIDEDDGNGGVTTTKLVFSGDIGTPGRPILKDPEYIDSADVLIMETTYGDRVHTSKESSLQDLKNIIIETLGRGGTVVIPAFAVGRTQDMLYDIKQLLDKDSEFKAAMKGIKVYVDSPMAMAATEIFKKNAQVYDSDSRQQLAKGENPLSFENLVFVKDVFESQTLNHDTSPKVIISASGMCEAGRIKHHLKHNIWNPKNSVVFVGYQAAGTLGRSIVDGAQEVKIFGEPIHIAAEIYNLKGFSGHADRNGLLKWLSAMSSLPGKIFLVHGEEKSKESFHTLVKEKLGADAYVIRGESTADITAGVSVESHSTGEDEEKLDTLINLRSKLADIHHEIEHILYTTTLAADDSMSDEHLQRITDAVMNIDKDTANLASAVGDRGEPQAYGGGNSR